MNNKPIYLCLAHMSGNEQKFIQEAFDTNWVVPLGPNVNGFEEDIKGWLATGAGTNGSRAKGQRVIRTCNESIEVVALASGTAALHLALVQLGVEAGDEVICQSFTFCASANPIAYLGATPVFVDSEEDSWNISPILLEEAIKDRIDKTGKLPKAIIPVHLYGMPAKMDEVCTIASKYNIPIVEDAAEAMGSVYKGQQCGTFGKFGVLSFNGNKMITTSGGGALICCSEEDKKNTMFYATQARENEVYYQHEKIGYNYRMSNICAGIGRGQMTVLDDHIAHHRMIHSLYEEAFSEIDGIELKCEPNSDFVSNYWLSTILIDKDIVGVDHIDIMNALQKHNIESRPLWKPLHLQLVFADAPAYINGVSEALFNQGLCLPSGPCVTEEDVRLIVEIIRKSLIF